MVFDSALVYERSILKTYAERYLLEVPLDHSSAATAYRLRKMLDPYVTIYPDHVPGDEATSSVLEPLVGSCRHDRGRHHIERTRRCGSTQDVSARDHADELTIEHDRNG